MYVGDDVASAVREKLREHVLSQSLIPASMARSFVVSAILMDRSFDCADVNSADAVSHGVTRMLPTMDDYHVPQLWASAFQSAGFHGVRYGSSFTNGSVNAWALFGEEGEHAFGEAVLAISGAAACAVAVIDIYDVPHSEELDTL